MRGSEQVVLRIRYARSRRDAMGVRLLKGLSLILGALTSCDGNDTGD